MKAAITIAIFSLAALFSECGFGQNLYKPYRTKNYELSNSHIESNLYRTKDGNLRRLPFLPSGLFVICRKNELPVLDYQKRIEHIRFMILLQYSANTNASLPSQKIRPSR